VPRLIRDGHVVQPSLGISAAGPDLNRVLGLPKGVALARVQRGGPAARAGLRAFARGEDGIVPGDVVTAVDEVPVETLDDLLSALERHEPGDNCTLTLWRAGTTRRQVVTLAGTDD